MIGTDAERQPAVLEPGGTVVGERGGHMAFAISGDNQSSFEQHLEPIADAEDQLARIAELIQGVSQECLQLHSEDLPRCNIVAIGEPAGDEEQLVFVEESRPFAETIDVDPFGFGAGLFESEGSFQVAVGPGGTQNQSANVSHEDLGPGLVRSLRPFLEFTAKVFPACLDFAGHAHVIDASLPGGRGRFDHCQQGAHLGGQFSEFEFFHLVKP